MGKSRNGVELDVRLLDENTETVGISNVTGTAEVSTECLRKRAEDFLELFVQVFINTELDTLTGQRDNGAPVEKEEN